MSAGAELQFLKKSALFGRLAQGRSAGVTVVTPNQRLSLALARDFDSHQSSRGLASWESADILPFSAFIERLYQDALYSELASGLPVLLAAAEEQTLWEAAIAASESGKALLSESSAATLAREAWQIAHEWKLAPRLKTHPANDDARAFSEWAWRYEGITQRDRRTDRARLPETVAQCLSHAAVGKPGTLVAYGFDTLKPQQVDFFAALEKAGVQILACRPQSRVSQARRIAFVSSKDEIHAAASWARVRLEANPQARIGVVVPDLARSRDTVRRIFAQTMEPARPLRGEARPLPFDLSLGEPLASRPLVAAVFLALDAAGGEIEFSRASRLIRSPFIAGAESEAGGRARLDAGLRKACGAGTSLARLRRAITRLTASDNRYRLPACPILSRRLADAESFARENLSGARPPAEWARAISELLEIFGFPGERALDSSEYQTLTKFHDTLAGFAALDRVAGRLRFADACVRLQRIAADTPFQPEAPEVPVEVLGIIEAAGQEFDHLWVMGLTDEAWPNPARPNPFIPVALQRAAGVPESSAGLSLELDRRRTQGWLEAAGEVVLSHAMREEDRELAVSPLIRGVPASSPEELALPAYEGLRDAMRRARGEERAPDSRAPALPVNAVSSGGTSVFGDQAACPFRGFARHRLDAASLEVPPPGSDARDRGTLVHAMLAKVWSELKTKDRLDVISDADLDSLLAAAADVAIARLHWSRPDALAGRSARLERERLIRLGRDWLDRERARPAFEVVEIEKKRAVSLGGVTVNAKLDRMDRLQGGAHAILDYKTGEANTGAWLGARPDEPQLPLYAVTSGTDVAAVAFARVRAGEMKFSGIARKKALIPEVDTLAEQRSKAAKRYRSWDELVSGWRGEFEALGREFASGEARVDPKEPFATCRYCDVKPLCRIYERYGDKEAG